MAATRTAAKKAGEVLQGKSPKVHIQLSGLPRTALPNDLRRLCGKSNVEHVSNVAIYYERFRPTGTGILSFGRPEYASAACRALDDAVVGGKRVKAQQTALVAQPHRTRGTKGILEAAARGIITGDGPGGGITASGRNVVLYGLPGRITPTALVENLRGFKLAGAEYGKEVVVKLDASDRLTSSSRFLVRTTSVSEAYRLVRKFHMQPWRPDLNSDKYILRAFVVW